MSAHPSKLGTPREVLDVVKYGGVAIRCLHCKRTAPRLLVVDDGDEAGPALCCRSCLERAGGRTAPQEADSRG